MSAPSFAPVAPGAPSAAVRPVVLQSFRALRPTTNPYLTQLARALEPLADVRTFTWRQALLGRWDVLHLHWPELLARRSGRVRSTLGLALHVLLLLRARASHRPVVRTLHNVRPHEHRGRLEDLVLALTDRWTTLWICLNPADRAPGGAPSELVPIGDYRGWFAGHDVPTAVAGRVASVGLVRRYKGLDDLLAAFADAREPVRSLRVVGAAGDASSGDVVRAACAADPRVTARLEHVPDADLVREVGEAAVVALPYRQVQNSSATVLALSLGRPVLVPDNALNRALAEEVGPGWVHLFDPPLTARHLQDAVAAAAHPPTEPPDLSARAWPLVAARHRAAYDRALALTGRGAAS